jgi:hypothetical protein
MIRLQNLHPDTRIDRSTTRVLIIIVGIVLAQMTLQIALATGLARWPAMGAGAVVAFVAGVSLAGYETSSTV